MMQSASLFGLHGLSVLAVLIFAGPAAMAPAPALRERHVAFPLMGLTLLAALGVYGFIRLQAGVTAFAQDTTIRVVQPNLDQLQKWRPENRETVLRTYLALSAPEDAPLPPGAVLVWPESAFPFALTEDPEALGAIADLLPPGTALVTGAYRQEHDPSGEQRFFNSIYVIGDDGTILDAYDKTHLVPFGEYLPAGAALGPLGLRQMVQDGFSAGPRRRSLNLPSAPPFSPLICYEAIFSGAVLGEGPRPGFLMNVTNDGWFGRTVGPHQHFHQARLRSAEEGLPMVRAANTGISAVIDPYGRVVGKTRLAQALMFETRLPRAVEPTFYSKWRGNVVLALLVVCLMTAGSKILYPAYRL
jgi:apolipoprotein N-acyltransferase